MDVITALFLTATTAFNLPPGLLSSLCFVESGHNISAIHHDDGAHDSIGICQVQYRSAYAVGFRGTEQELMDPKVNIIVAGAILKTQINRYHNVKRGVIAYNIGNAKGLTTSKYADKVYEQWRVK